MEDDHHRTVVMNSRRSIPALEPLFELDLTVNLIRLDYYEAIPITLLMHCAKQNRFSPFQSHPANSSICVCSSLIPKSSNTQVIARMTVADFEQAILEVTPNTRTRDSLSYFLAHIVF